MGESDYESTVLDGMCTGDGARANEYDSTGAAGPLRSENPAKDGRDVRSHRCSAVGD